MAGPPASLGSYLEQLEAIERRLGETARTITTKHPGLRELAARIAAASADITIALERRREQIGVADRRTQSAPARGLAGLLAEAAVGAAALHAAAHRAFDSQADGNTADLAETRLAEHLRWLGELLDMTSDLVVHELGSVGEDCRCGCPACGLGLCLCSPHGTNTVRQARGAAEENADGGLRVRRPRRGSPAEGAGLREGERVLAIDDTPIGHDLDTATVQTAIRARAAGEDLRLRVAAHDGSVREVVVRRS